MAASAVSPARPLTRQRGALLSGRGREVDGQGGAGFLQTAPGRGPASRMKPGGQESVATDPGLLPHTPQPGWTHPIPSLSASRGPTGAQVSAPKAQAQRGPQDRPPPTPREVSAASGCGWGVGRVAHAGASPGPPSAHRTPHPPPCTPRRSLPRAGAGPSPRDWEATETRPRPASPTVRPTSAEPGSVCFLPGG